MSDLIEKVARAICLADEQNGAAPYEYRMQNKHIALAVNDQARAAIAAVAEWMIDEFSYQAEMIEIKEGIDAALRAAGDGR